MPNRTPTPGSTQAHAQRQGVKINELVGPEGEMEQQTSQANVKQEGRTLHDTSMVQALSRGPM